MLKFGINKSWEFQNSLLKMLICEGEFQNSLAKKQNFSQNSIFKLNFSKDENYLLSTNAGDNSVIIYKINHKNGELTKILCLPVSGDYPKDAALFPDNKNLVSLNHESNTLTFFHVDLSKGLIVMNGKEIPIEKPNCVIFHRLEEEQNKNSIYLNRYCFLFTQVAMIYSFG